METIVNNKKPWFLKALSFFAFFIFIFAAFFGTSLPFSERPQDIDEIATSNPINQIVYSLLFIISFFTLIFVRERVFFFFKSEKLLFFLIIWCILTMIWSNYPLVSFKRFFQFFTSILVCLSILLYAESNNEIKRYVYIVLAIFIPLSLLSVFIEPGALDPSTLSWRGLAKSKNLLGQTALVSIIFWAHFCSFKTMKHYLVGIPMILMSIVLLIGSKSMTSSLVFLFIIISAIFLFFDKTIFRLLGIGHIFTIISFTIIILLFFTISVVDIDFLIHFPEYFGKDSSFTGRTDLWADIFNETRNHFILGCGYGAFWVVGNPALNSIYRIYHWLPNQSHMGYLDLLNELGIVGILLFTGMCFSFVKNINRSTNASFWKWFFIVGLIVNFQETTFFSVKHISSVLFFLSYMVLSKDLMDTSGLDEWKEERKLDQ